MDQVHIEIKSMQQEINKLRERINQVMVNLAKLKSENTYKSEKLEWIEEKRQKLDREQRSIHMKIKNSHKKSYYDSKKPREVMLERAMSNYHILGYIHEYLNQYNRQLDKFGSMRNKKPSDQSSEALFPTINIKLNILTNQDKIRVFRLDSNTDFFMLIKISFKLWSLDKHLVNSDINEEDALDMLILTDENNSSLDISQNVIQFYNQKGIINISQITLLLQSRINNKSTLNNQQINSIKISGNQKGLLPLQQIKVNKNRIRKIDSYKFFFNFYPGLRYFISEMQVKKQEQVQIKKQQELIFKQHLQSQATSFNQAPQQSMQQSTIIDDNHCLIFTLYLILLFLALLSNSYYINPVKINTYYRKLLDAFDIDDYGSYNQIRTINDFWKYFRTVGDTLLFNDQYDNLFRFNNELVGPIVLRQLRANIYECKKVVNQLQKQSCFDPFYSDINGNYSSFNGYKYSTRQQYGIQYYLETNFSYIYDGGFLQFFDRDILTSQFQGDSNRLIKNGFIDEYTQVLLVQFTSASPQDNVWIQGTLLIERNANNQFIPYRGLLEGFMPNMYYGHQGASVFRIDLAKLLFTILATCYLINKLINIFKEQSFGKGFEYILLDVGLFNLSISVCSLAHIICQVAQFSLQHDVQDLLNQSGYVNLQFAVALYQLSKIFSSFTIFFLLIRLIYIFKFNTRIQLIFNVFKKGSKELFKFLAIQFPIFVGFCFVFQIQFGNSNSDFSTFKWTMLSLVDMVQGEFELPYFSSQNPIASMICITFYYLFMVIFFLVLFQSRCCYDKRISIKYHLRIQFWGFSSVGNGLEKTTAQKKRSISENS
ncbi:hypothetical protein pb186bvf_008718 [Paramecium bursaria]